LTYQVTPEMQLRASASKTIARPQFRELIFQTYYDPDSNRSYRGNPLLTDSQLYNAEARFEWYFARDQRLTAAGFYKKIRHPIETFASFSDNDVVSSFANAPRATLYGAEIETQKYFPLNGLGRAHFWASRRAVVIANYTCTRSKISVKADDPVAVFASAATRASDLFRDGEPLTGQSDHIVNLQFGLEDTDRLSQQTFLVTYASKRVTNRGAGQQPDIYEYPGLKLDFVARQGFSLRGAQFEGKVEIRNITGTKYKEYQQSGDNRIYYNFYKPGTIFMFGLSATL
jgi:outer membrane receptor protein involved in Fe transport